MQRAIHSRFFSRIYGLPKQRDNFRSVIISVYGIYIAVCVCAFKHFVCSFSNMFTFTASLRTVSRIDHNEFNPIEQSLIFKFYSQICKAPFTKFCPKLFVSPFRSKPDIGKVFNGNTFTLFFCRCYNRFTYCVVNQISRCSFLATKPFRQLPAIPFSGTLRGVCLCLNRTTNFLPMFTISIKPLGRMVNTIRSCYNSCQTKITTDKFLNVFNIFFGNVNGLKQVKLAFLINQIRFTFNVRQVVSIMANKGNFNPATDSPKGNNIVGFVSHNPAIITNASKRSKLSFGFLIQFVAISNFCNTSYNNLTTKFKSSLVFMINLVMQFKIIENTLLPSHIRNGIANSISFLNRVEKQVSLFIGRQKLYFQCQLHSTKIRNNFIYKKIITNFVKQFNYGAAIPSIGSKADQWVSLPKSL